MAVRDPLRDEAFKLFRNSKGKMTSKEIAEKLNKSVNTINSWRNKDEWSKKLKGGAPRGNSNAKGHGAPKGNLNNLKHGEYCDPSKFLDKGFLAKYIPAATKNIIKGVLENGVTHLDMLWDNIVLLYSSIIRSQKIMYVKNQDDITKVKTKEAYGENSSTEEWEYQFAWDKQEKFIKSQSSAMKTLNSMVKDYEELLHKNWDLATEEQKLRIEKLKLDISKITGEENTDKNKNTKLDSILEQLSE
ncbi:phage terminase small subunit [Clostridium sp.]|uniref:phage terminase small subunit n=1 Tax=Clostridium sp. TaxID=1506 RepID=UPI0039A3E79C